MKIYAAKYPVRGENSYHVIDVEHYTEKVSMRAFFYGIKKMELDLKVKESNQVS